MSTADVYALMAGPNNSQIVDSGPTYFVPVDQALPAQLGPENQQQFQSGVTNNVKSNPSAEQGMGRSPGQQWAHYPHVQQTNPFRDAGVRMRDGQDGYNALIYRPESSLIWQHAMSRELMSPKFQGPTTPTVNQAFTELFAFAVPQNPGY